MRSSINFARGSTLISSSQKALYCCIHALFAPDAFKFPGFGLYTEYIEKLPFFAKNLVLVHLPYLSLSVVFIFVVSEFAVTERTPPG